MEWDWDDDCKVRVSIFTIWQRSEGSLHVFKVDVCLGEDASPTGPRWKSWEMSGRSRMGVVDQALERAKKELKAEGIPDWVTRYHL